MTSGPVVVMVLGENAVEKNRQLMGATNPQEAEAEQFALILQITLMPMLYMVAIV